jgi:hypothetical protein
MAIICHTLKCWSYGLEALVLEADTNLGLAASVSCFFNYMLRVERSKTP